MYANHEPGGVTSLTNETTVALTHEQPPNNAIFGRSENYLTYATYAHAPVGAQTHLEDLNFEVVDRWSVALTASVDRLSGEDRRSAHVVREHLHQEVNVAELGREGGPHDVVRASHYLRTAEYNKQW